MAGGLSNVFILHVNKQLTKQLQGSLRAGPRSEPVIRSNLAGADLPPPQFLKIVRPEAAPKGARHRRILMQRQDERDIRELLVRLRTEHRELDSEIVALEAEARLDQLLISRLKKKKLKLKDQITALEDQLLPDIIA